MDPTLDSQLMDAIPPVDQVYSYVYCVQQSVQALPTQHLLIPNYEMLLVFSFGPDIPISLGHQSYLIQQTAVIGPLQKLLRYELAPGADVMVVNFTLNGFYRLVGLPMHQLRGMDVFNPDVLLGDEGFQTLWAQLASTNQLNDRLQRLNEYILTHLMPPDEGTHSLMSSLPHFRQPAMDPVKTVARMHQLSPRGVQLRFQTHLGYSAKELLRFLRFKNAVALVVQQFPLAPDWADLVFRYGYHDQSHLIKDFQQFMAMTPTEFLRQLAGQSVCIPQAGKYY